MKINRASSFIGATVKDQQGLFLGKIHDIVIDVSSERVADAVLDSGAGLGVGLIFCLCGLFLHSLTEWTFRQTHIFLNFNILVGTLASLCYAKRQARRQLVEAERFDELPDFEFSQAVTRNAQPCV